MATSSLSAARRCTQSCITGSQCQSPSFVRHKSTTSAIKSGLRASRREIPDRYSKSRGSRRGVEPRSDAFKASSGRSRDSLETKWDQKRDNRGRGLDGKISHDNDLWKDASVLESGRRGGFDGRINHKKDIWEGTVDLKSDRNGGSRGEKGNEKKTEIWNGAVDSKSHGKGGRHDQSSHGHGPSRTSRFENQGVRSYGASAGFFSKGTRSNRDTERPSTRAFDRSARPSQVGPFSMRRRPSRSPIEESTTTRGENGELNQNDNVPISIPYSSAASQWLYGANTVIGALRGKKRTIYQLIIKKGEKTSEANQILRLAKEADIPIKTHDDTRLLDKLSDGRPHNGIVLETSALPARPVAHLRKPDSQRGEIPLVLYQQNAEDAAINGTSTAIQYNASSWRQPLVLFLDGILDPQNVGGILRTAHFYGVDAVAVSTRTCASLTSAFLAKASAGACEAIPILAVSKAADFILKSGLAGWHVCAAVAPDVRSQKLSKQATTAGISLSSPLAKKPCILMMGSEGEGLRDNLRSKADLEVTIERAMPAVDVGVDSMNVSVATGILVDAFMRQPNTAAGTSNSSNRIF